MNAEFVGALRQIEEEKNIPYEVLLDTVKSALASAYKKRYGAQGEIRVALDPESGQLRVLALKTVVVDALGNPMEISVADAQAIRSGAQAGDVVEVEVTPGDFGRIAAQTAKQVVFQRIREAEREIVFNEFTMRRDEVMTCEVQRRDNGNVYVTLGRAEAMLPLREQIPTERPYAVHRRMKVYVLDVRKSPRSPQVIISRTHPGLIRRLFELEVPEVYDGIVEIKAVEREPGYRTKIAVLSHDEKVDPVGACVGHRGSRVQAVVDELNGEKIDIIKYSEDIRQYLTNALNPAHIAEVVPVPGERTATVIVPDEQLSLAIGKRGQNVRLASRLTGWKIDIVGYDEYQAKKARVLVAGVDPAEMRIRVYDLAGELSLTSKEAIEHLNSLGYPVASHASTIDGYAADALRRLVKGEEAMKYRAPEAEEGAEAGSTGRPTELTAREAAARLVSFRASEASEEDGEIDLRLTFSANAPEEEREEEAPGEASGEAEDSDVEAPEGDKLGAENGK